MHKTPNAFFYAFFVSKGKLYTDNTLFTDTLYNDEIRYNDNLTVTKPSLKRKQIVTNYARIVYLIL